MNIKLNYLLISFLTISLAGNVLFYFKIGELEEKIQKISQYQYKNQSSSVAKNENQDQNNNITYKTFSSPKADFTFEYPSAWAYDEKEIKNTMVWGFYPNLEGNYRNRPPYLEVHSPTYETVDFFSSGYKGTKHPYQLNTFPTNDPETYVTYEQGESGGKAYIYWQKGKAFASASCIGDIYFKVNIMIFHGSDELDGKEVAQHMAKSIKVK